MRIANNTIRFEGFKVVLDLPLHVAMPGYIEEMAEYLEGQQFETPAGAEFALMMVNNDGSWQVVVGLNK